MESQPVMFKMLNPCDDRRTSRRDTVHRVPTRILTASDVSVIKVFTKTFTIVSSYIYVTCSGREIEQIEHENEETYRFPFRINFLSCFGYDTIGSAHCWCIWRNISL